MQQVLRLCATAFTVVALAYLAGVVSAQAPAPAPVKQIKLSEKQVEGFIAAHKDMAEAFDKMAGEKSEAAALAQLNKIAKKFGFKDHGEYDEVATNVAMVMFGIDPQTKVFTDPPTLAKKELDDAMADKTLPEKERKQLVEELSEQLKTVQPIMHPGNIELIKKYYDKIEPLLQ
jgi:hypothetical protein